MFYTKIRSCVYYKSDRISILKKKNIRSPVGCFLRSMNVPRIFWRVFRRYQNILNDIMQAIYKCSYFMQKIVFFPQNSLRDKPRGLFRRCIAISRFISMLVGRKVQREVITGIKSQRLNLIPTSNFLVATRTCWETVFGMIGKTTGCICFFKLSCRKFLERTLHLTSP